MHSIFLPRPALSSSPPAPPVLRITPTLRAAWPAWTRVLARFRRPTDTGLGDTLVHLIGDARSEKFKKWYARKFGKTCGCTNRQRWLNQKFPYRES